MEKYFWREKNADSLIGEYEVVVPTNEQLFDELIKKMYEKAEMIDVIFNKEKRLKYLQSKGKVVDDNILEIVIQQKIGSRVIVDFMQLTLDICSAKNIKFQELNNIKLEKEKIKDYIIEALSNIREEFDNSVSKICGAYICLAEILQLNITNLEMERQKIEDKEGTFYKGKFVIKD